MSARSLAVFRRRIAPELEDDGGGGTQHNFGLVNSADTASSTSNLDAAVLLMTMRSSGALSIEGEAGNIDRGGGSSDYGAPAGSVDSPDGVKMMRGELADTTPWYSNPSPSGAFSSLQRTPVGALLGSAMAERYAGDSNRTKTVSSAADGNTYTLADATGVEAGMVICHDINGRRSLDLITDVDGTTIKLLHGAHVAHGDLPANHAIRLGAQYDLTAHAAKGPSVVDVLDLLSERREAFGGRLTSLSMQFQSGGDADANAQIDWNFTVRYAGINKADSAADVADYSIVRAKQSTPSGRKIAETAHCIFRMSTANTMADDADPTVPVTGLATTELKIESMSLSVTWGMTPYGKSAADIGVQDMHEQAQPDVSLELIVQATNSRIETLRGRYYNDDGKQNYHSLMIPFGPLGAHGGGICMPTAVLTDDPTKLDGGKGYRRYILRFRHSAAHIVDSTSDRAGLKIVSF